MRASNLVRRCKTETGNNLSYSQKREVGVLSSGLSVLPPFTDAGLRCRLGSGFF